MIVITLHNLIMYVVSSRYSLSAAAENGATAAAPRLSACVRSFVMVVYNRMMPQYSGETIASRNMTLS